MLSVMAAMQVKKRFLIVVLALLSFALYIKEFTQQEDHDVFDVEQLPSMFDSWADKLINLQFDNEASVMGDHFNKNSHYNKKKSFTDRTCRMETCFDFNRCHIDFKVFVYPEADFEENQLLFTKSPLYQKILDVIIESRYHTNDPNQACLFVIAIDTLDRDPLSPDYVRNVPLKLQKLKHWNGGKNHIIFNLYSGTWPNYAEDDLGFDTGEAILAKASMSVTSLRPGFDVSIPLFPKSHPDKGGEAGYVKTNNFPVTKNYLLGFKGKRYVHGIGSETRNSLYHLHNAKDVVLVTTCKHGKSWKNWKDERCDQDDNLYDKYDYDILLQNSSFCLVPRGRRLGSFRFLEALQAGCVPVLLSNGWALPFMEVIDWNKAVIWGDERLLLQIPEMLRMVDKTKAFFLRQQTQILWEQYFSSIDKIVFTTFEIIRQRLPLQQYHDGLIWNNAPGALLTQFDLSDSLHSYPFHYDMLGYSVGPNFTAVIYSQMSISLTANSVLFRLLQNIAKSQFASQIIIVWCNDKYPYNQMRWPIFSQIPLNVINSPGSLQRFHPLKEIQTEAVLSLDEDTLLTTDEIDFAFQVWRSFPQRIVGYPARSHYWDESKNSWGYTSKWTNDYSIVLTGAAFYHHYYNHLYTKWLSPLLLKTVEQSNNCEDILMNFLISHVTRQPPIKVTQRKHYKEQPAGGSFSRSPWNDPDHFIQRQTCLNTFVALFGYMPLIRSNLRLDPILFKDPVSNLRKKYRQIEVIGN